MDNNQWKTKRCSTGFGCVATRVIEGVVEVRFPENGYDFSHSERDWMALDDLCPNA